MIKLKMCLALALISATLLTALPFYSYADNAGQNEQKADVSLVSEDIVQIEEQPVVYAASSGGQWIKESNGRWWYKHADGSYTKYNWEYIDGNWYFFDKNGWMWTDWLEWKGDWYYLDLSSGKMHTGWSKINGEWYYFKSNGIMNIMPFTENGRLYTFYHMNEQKGMLRSTIIDLPREQQEMSFWCWAASSLMVGRYNTHSQMNQSQVVWNVKGIVLNIGGNENDEVNGIYYASENTKNAKIVGNDKFVFTNIVSLIDSNHPLIMNLYWNDGSKHAVVCAGYDRHTGQIWIIDPWGDDESTYYDYKTFMKDVTILDSRGHCVNMVKY